LAEFWTSADWPPYSLGFNLLDFPICIILQGKVQATPYADLAILHLSIAMEWD
jgi:hypothetical protein